MTNAQPLLRCPLCGNEFAADAGCQSGCVLASHCLTVCCPRCHYRFVERSPVADLLRRLLGGRKP